MKISSLNTNKKTVLGLLILISYFISNCSEKSIKERESTLDVVLTANDPVQIIACNDEKFDIFIAFGGYYNEGSTSINFTTRWHKLRAEFCDPEVTDLLYPFVGNSSTTNKFGIGQSIVAAMRTENGYYLPENPSGTILEAFPFVSHGEPGYCYAPFNRRAAFDSYEKLWSDFRTQYICTHNSLNETGYFEYPYNQNLPAWQQKCDNGTLMAARSLNVDWDSGMSQPQGSCKDGDAGEGERWRISLRHGKVQPFNPEDTSESDASSYVAKAISLITEFEKHLMSGNVTSYMQTKATWEAFVKQSQENINGMADADEKAKHQTALNQTQLIIAPYLDKDADDISGPDQYITKANQIAQALKIAIESKNRTLFDQKIQEWNAYVVSMSVKISRLTGMAATAHQEGLDTGKRIVEEASQNPPGSELPEIESYMGYAQEIKSYLDSSFSSANFDEYRKLLAEWKEFLDSSLKLASGTGDIYDRHTDEIKKAEQLIAPYFEKDLGNDLPDIDSYLREAEAALDRIMNALDVNDAEAYSSAEESWLSYVDNIEEIHAKSSSDAVGQHREKFAEAKSIIDPVGGPTYLGLVDELGIFHDVYDYVSHKLIFEIEAKLVRGSDRSMVDRVKKALNTLRVAPKPSVAGLLDGIEEAFFYICNTYQLMPDEAIQVFNSMIMGGVNIIENGLTCSAEQRAFTQLYENVNQTLICS